MSTLPVFVCVYLFRTPAAETLILLNGQMSADHLLGVV